MPTVREAVIDLLRHFGMTTIFGNPGSTELPFLRDFPEDFRYVLGLQEASVLGMAEGYARGTGNATLINLHTAPGLGNAMGAMVTAYQDKTPLIVTAGQQDRRHVALEPLLTGKLVELAQPYVKRSYEPPRAEDVPFEMQRAYHTAMQHPQGPVLLSIPMDDWDAKVEPPAIREVSYRTAPDPEAIQSIAEGLAGARSPALVVGPGMARTGTFDGVVALAEKLNAAVWQEPICALSGFPQNHRLFQGHLPAAQKAMAGKLSPYDVVLVLGAPVFTYYPYVPGPVVEDGTRVFQITEDPEEAARAAIGESAVGDLAQAMRGLADLLPESSRSVPPERGPAQTPEASEPMSVAYAMHAISEVLPEAPVIVDESTSSKGSLHEHVRVDEPEGHHTSAAGGLGFGIPASVGLKLALPERAVVCVIGDGSSMYSIQALYTAARYEVAVPILVINNSGYSILKGFRDAIGVQDVPGLDLPDIDIVQIARGFGCEGVRVEKPEDLRPTLERALVSEEPYVVDIAVDRTVPEMFG
ncbi:MAG TPA: benzoylformate decarboxylase [Rubrobacteraceae bacterium]|nr:benzoylformate decarboxylase [Rubrobacteraceae bacterium]